MRTRIGIAAAALLGLATTPAAAADWASVAGWDVYEINGRQCVVGRVFPTGLTFGVILATDGEVRLFATSGGWRADADRGSAADVLLDGRSQLGSRSAPIVEGGATGFVAAAAPAFLQSFAGGGTMSVRPDPGSMPATVVLTGSNLGLAQAQRCLANLRIQSGAPPQQSFASNPRGTPVALAATPQPVAARLATRPAPRRPKSTWIEADDYPTAALREEAEGSVTVKLAVNTRGEVDGCDVVRSSGSALLDAATCNSIRRRARYAPATDTTGRPVAGEDSHTVRWTLPN